MGSPCKPGWALPVVLVLVACGVYALLTLTRESLDGDGRPGRDEGALDVVLVVVDTERTDRTSTYGHERLTTPFLSAMARKGVLFTHAYSTGPWTVPSMYSLVTGLYPGEHGIETGAVEGLDIKGQEALPPEAVTLAERLDGAGYETFGVCTNFHVSRRFGFGQGFDHFVGEDFAFLPFPNMAVESLHERIMHSSRYFLWLHYFDPHHPYIPRLPWFARWNDSGLDSYGDIVFEAVMNHYDGERELPPGSPIFQRDVVRIDKTAKIFSMRPFLVLRHLSDEGVPPEKQWVRFLDAAYTSEIRNVDRAMQEAITSLGIDEQTLVVLTADHGEELYDHGKFGHRNNDSLYEELIHVPLVIIFPDQRWAGRVVETPVSLIDLVPTVLEVLGMDVPPDLSGRSLVQLLEGEPWAIRPIYAEVTDGWNPVRAIIDWPWKYVHRFSPGEGELYDLEQDPHETTDLSDVHPRIKSYMRRTLVMWAADLEPRWEASQPTPLTLEEIKKLKLLGYIQ